MLAFAVGSGHRLYALSTQLQIDSIVSHLLANPTKKLQPKERRQFHAFFSYFSGFAREVITESYLQPGRNLAVSVSHALNPEAAFFGVGTPLSCPSFDWWGCGEPLLVDTPNFRSQALNGRLSVGSHHSRAEDPMFRGGDGGGDGGGGDDSYYTCPWNILSCYAPTKEALVLFFQYGQIQHLACKNGCSPKTTRFL